MDFHNIDMFMKASHWWFDAGWVQQNETVNENIYELPYEISLRRIEMALAVESLFLEDS